MQKAPTDYLLYIEALQRGLVTPILPCDFRRLSNRRMAYAFRVAERRMMRAVADMMRQLAKAKGLSA